LIRVEGNDENLKELSGQWAAQIGAGHTFVMILKDAYPVNVLGRIKDCPEVCGIFCATANPVEVLIAQSDLGRGVVGVIDGAGPKGVEGPDDVKRRREFLRKIGYKL
jgi:adenosine/AMP kinase